MEEKKQIKGTPEFEEIWNDRNGVSNFLVLHNDEIHTFEYVIESLMDVCEHNMEQAEQCTYLVHYKGKCDIKKGLVKSLLPLKKELGRRGLLVSIQ